MRTTAPALLHSSPALIGQILKCSICASLMHHPSIAVEIKGGEDVWLHLHLNVYICYINISVEEILRALTEYAIFKLDRKGIIEEAYNFEEEVGGETLLNVVSEEDRKRAAKLFIDAIQTGKAEGIIRLRKNDSYQIFDFRFLKIEDSIYVIAKEIRKEKPSFITDFLGNVIYAGEEWKALDGKNLFDVVEDRESFMNAIKTAIEAGEYEGNVSINERKAKIRIKATQWLEFFIEEDIYRLLEEILDSKNIGEIFERIKKVMDYIGIEYYLRLFDMEAGGKGEAFHSFNILKRSEVVGEIEVFEEINDLQRQTLQFLSMVASKAIEGLENINAILQDFAIYKIDDDGRIVYVNEKFEEVTGYRAEEIINKDIANFAEKREEFMKELEKGYVENFIAKWKGKGKEIIAKEYARKVNGETVAILEDVTYEKEKEREAEFYNSVLRHDIFNKNEIALGYLGLLEKTNLTKKQKAYIQKIKEVIGDANKLIENVRRAEEIRKAKGELKNVNVGRVVEKICKTYEEEAKKYGIEIECSVDDVEVIADEFLGEIFSNLIKNSIQHAECSTIKIHGEKEGEFYKIYYEDNGKGIDEKYRDKIFEEGWRLGGSGSGLGLYIVKKLMVRYGGKVEVETGAGKGMKFVLYFKMPRKKGRADFLKIRI